MCLSLSKIPLKKLFHLSTVFQSFVVVWDTLHWYVSTKPGFFVFLPAVGLVSYSDTQVFLLNRERTAHRTILGLRGLNVASKVEPVPAIKATEL